MSNTSESSEDSTETQSYYTDDEDELTSFRELRALRAQTPSPAIPTPPSTYCFSQDDESKTTVCLAEQHLGTDIYYRYSEDERNVARRAVDLMWAVSHGTIKPTKQQLDCVISLQCQSKDVIYIAATGSGKTLCIALMMLLNPNSLVITASPYIEIQRGQVCSNKNILLYQT